MTFSFDSYQHGHKINHSLGSIMQNEQVAQKELTLTGYQKIVIAILAFLQFTIVLDFMVLSPVGAILMPALGITSKQFGIVVSSYAFAAAASGILAAGFADKYDRKKILLFFYIGFVVSTFLCGIAPNYNFLLFARTMTGIFGGVIGSVVFAITTDLFHFSKRGQVIGYIQTAFALSQILGVPLALYLASDYGWHAPFLLIVATSIIVGFLIFYYLKPVDAHLALKTDQKPLHHLWSTVKEPLYLKGFSSVALLALGGFMIMPFASAFAVGNVGISFGDLPLVYLVTGLTAFVAGPLLGRVSDRVGKLPVFLGGTILTGVMIIIYTHLSHSTLTVLLVVNAMLFIGITARMISFQAINTAVPRPKDRGAYMSISSSMQQVSGGLGAAIAGMVVSMNSDGSISHFEVIGYIVAASCLITFLAIRNLTRISP